jgi:hypothetical protein
MTTKITAANLVANAITTSRLSDSIAVDQVDSTLISPTITSVTYDAQTAATPNTANTITITGTGFDSNTQVLINNQLCSSVTYISTTQLQAVTPLLAAGAYDLLVNNSYSLFCLKKNYVNFDLGPAWTTAAGVLGSVNESTEISTVISPVVATSNSTVRYSYKDGIMPPGTAINTDTGQLTGITTQVVSGSSTTYYFTLNAIDAENQSTPRTFGVTVIPEVVTWSSPADGSTITNFVNNAVSQSLSATSSFGNTVSYSATNLPVGVNISGNVISGTPTVAGTVATTIIASVSTGRSASRTLNFNITPTVVPSAPTIGLAVTGSPNSATISYTAPAASGGAGIISYTAVSSPGGISATVTQAGSGSIYVGGLSAGTAYTFTVYATNSVGNSPASSASNSITTAVAPAIATTLNANGTVSLSWNNFTGGTPTSYQVLVDGVSQSTVTSPSTSLVMSAGADRLLTINAYNQSTFMSAVSAKFRLFSTTGGQQNWTVPAGVTYVMADTQGAQGGSTGGQGGRTKTYITTTPSETLYMYVGGQGGSGYRSPCGGNPGQVGGGFNGGGIGGSVSDGYGCPSGLAYALGPGGGGASDIRQGGNALANRIVVSGGGGGGAYPNSGCGGTPATVGQGAGYNTNAGEGGVTGLAACGGGWPFGAQGRAASTSAGGSGGSGSVYSGTAGSLGQGGNGQTGAVGGDNPGYGGGGGGGYYGGGGAGSNSNYGSAGSGGGGSGFLAGGLTSLFSSYGTSSAGYNTGNGQIFILW